MSRVLESYHFRATLPLRQSSLCPSGLNIMDRVMEIAQLRTLLLFSGLALSSLACAHALQSFANGAS